MSPFGERPPQFAISLNTTTITTAAGAVISSALSGDMLVKSGPAQLTLSGNNIYGTGTSVTEGTLKISALADSGLSNIGTGYLGIGGGTLEYTGSGSATTSRALWVNGSSGTFDVTNAAGTLSFTGNTGTINQAITKKGAGTLNSSHVISGSASVTVEAGTLSLTGTNTYSGTTTINGGTLVVQGKEGWDSANGSRVGNNVVVNNGGKLKTGANHQFGWTGTLANLTVNSGGTFDQNSKDHYLGTLTLNGNATLSNGSGHYLGLSGGAVNYTGTGLQQTTVATGLRLRDNPSTAVNATFTVSGTNTAGDLVVSGAIQDGGGLSKEGAGTLKLTGTNTYSGTTTINEGTLVVQGTPSWTAGANGSRVGNKVVVNNGGTLKTGDNHQFGWTNTLANLTVNNGGAFDQNSRDHYLGTLTLNGNATLSNGSGHYLGLSSGAVNYTGTGSQQTTVATGLRLQNPSNTAVPATFTVNGTNPTGDLIVSGVIDSGGGLTKTGGGILKLNGTNIYTGLTTVSGGVLGGSGSLAGPLTVGVAGTIAPGNSVGTFTVAGKTTLAGTYAAEINGGTSDLLAVTGALDLTSAKLTVNATAPIGSAWTIATYTGALTGSFASVPAGYTVNTATAGQVKLIASFYSNWAATNAPGQTAAQDYDGDGVSNGIEYVLGGSATTQDSGKLPTITTTGGNLVFTFKRIQSSKTLDTSVSIDVGTTLANWINSYPVGDTTSGPVTVEDIGGGYDQITVTLPKGTDTKKFVRLHVTIN